MGGLFDFSSPEGGERGGIPSCRLARRKNTDLGNVPPEGKACARKNCGRLCFFVKEWVGKKKSTKHVLVGQKKERTKLKREEHQSRTTSSTNAVGRAGVDDQQGCNRSGSETGVPELSWSKLRRWEGKDRGEKHQARSRLHKATREKKKERTILAAYLVREKRPEGGVATEKRKSTFPRTASKL